MRDLSRRVDRMYERILGKIAQKAEMNGLRIRVRPMYGFRNGVKKVLVTRGIRVEEARA